MALIIVDQTYASPAGGNVGAGNVVIQQSGGNTTINQSSARGIINWQSFNINQGETTHFNQPLGGVTLNRISPLQGASQIYGRLTATGQIILINPAGIYFGPSAFVNVGGLIASTADITDRDFLAGNYRFIQNPLYNGAIVNQGTLIASNHGLIALMGNAVQNDGNIQANLGTTILGSGSDFSISFASNDKISFKVNSNTLSRAVDKNGNQLPDGVRNTGRIVANGGQVIVSAQAARNVLDHAINMRGFVEAKSAAALPNGGVILGSNDKIVVAANIDTTGSGTTGGSVSIEAPIINIESSTNINASGDLGGGNITIGRTADITHVEPGTTLLSRALVKGNGGLVETSGHELTVNGVTVDTRSANGTAGTWLLDPTTINVDAALAATLVSQLALGNVMIQTVADNTSGTGDITFSSNVRWNAPYKFTVSAYRNILINSGVTIGGTNAGSSMALITNNGANFLLNSVGGFITQTGSINSAGPVDLYYNPTSAAYTNRTYTNSGSGLMTHYLYINNVANFNTLRNTSSIWSRNFALNANLNLSGISNYSPIGNVTTAFSGTFDGMGNALSSLTFTNGANNTGIFGVTSSTAVIKNLFIQNVNFSGTNNVGGIVGNNSGTVKNVGVLSGKIAASGNQLGGIVGLNSGTVSDVSNYAAVIGSPTSANVGGIIGRNNTTLTNALSVGVVLGGANAGAVVGTNFGTVNNSFWDLDTTGKTLGRGNNSGTFNAVGGCFYGCGPLSINALSNSDLYAAAGWDLTNTWGIIIASSYPYPKIRFPEAPQIISGFIAQYTNYLDDPAWASMPQHAKTPDWFYGYENLALSNLRIDLTGGASGAYYDSTYSNANGNFYMVEQRNFFPSETKVFQLQIGDSSYKSNTIFLMPESRSPMTLTPLILNTVSIVDNGNYGASYNGIPYQRFSNANFSNAFSTYRPNDILYTINGNSIALKDGYNLSVSPGIWFDLTNNISATNGSLSFFGELTVFQAVGVTNTFNLTTNTSGNIFIHNVHWMDNGNTTLPNLNTLKINAANNIIFDGYVESIRRNSNGVLLAGGTLDLSAAYTNHSITSTYYSNFNLFNLYLTKGKWYQSGVDGPLGSYYIFNVINDFRINPILGQAEFLRVGYGNGTLADPYTIPDIFSLQGIGSSPENLAAAWAIAWDSVFNINTMIHWNDGKGFVPIGNLSTPFSGSFDGRDFRLQAPVILRPNESYVGVFGVTAPTANISNVRVFLSPIQGNNYVGLIGYNQGNVSNVTLSESHVVGNNYVGAIAGFNSGNIYNVSTFSNRQLGNSFVGGVAGYNSGTIENAIVAHYIHGTTATGGLVGMNTGTIKNSFWDTDVTGQSKMAGVNTGTKYNVYGGCIGNLCTNGGMVNLSNPRTFLPRLMGEGYGLVSTWDFQDQWKIIPGYSYPYLDRQLGNVTVISGKLNPGYQNQLLALFGGIILTDNTHTLFLYPTVTGADGSFYSMSVLGLSPSNHNVILAIGSNINGSISYELPQRTALNPTGSIKNLTLDVKTNSSPSTNNLALSYEQVVGLFSGYSFVEISNRLNPFNDDATINNFLSYLVLYNNKLNYFYDSNQVSSLNYYYLYSAGGPIKVYTNLDENIRNLMKKIDSEDSQTLNRYDIQKITPNFCKI